MTTTGMTPTAVREPRARPLLPSNPPLVAEDAWDEAPTHVKDDSPTAPHTVEKVELPRARLESLIDAALAPVYRILRDLERRLEDLERRPRQNTLVAAPPPPALAPLPAPDPLAAAIARPAPAPAPPPTPAPAPAIAPAPAPAPVRIAQATPSVMRSAAPALDLAAIAHERHTDLDVPFDGARRRRRIAIGFVVFLVVVFGILFGVLAQSYMRSPAQ